MVACGGGGGGGSSGDPITIAPGVQIVASISVDVESPVTGQTVNFTPSVGIINNTSSPSLTVTQVVWNFGDGSPAVSISNAASFTAAQPKAYASTGSFIVTLSATDSSGRSGSITRSITVSSLAATGQLNDTGIDWCSENITTPSTWVNNVVCSAFNWGANLWGQQQDAYHGRDAQAAAGSLIKIGSGAAGFDYTRLGANGQPLAIQNAAWSDAGSNENGTRWECIRDNVTGLIWEVKTKHDASALRHYTATFTWFNPDNTKNGGSAGTEVDGTAAVCNGVADATRCNTQAYAVAVNAAGLCGFNDWRLPSKDELNSLTHLGRVNPAIDTNHFPDVNLARATWSASPDANDAGYAWFVDFNGGSDFNVYKDYGLSARLVRSGQ